MEKELPYIIVDGSGQHRFGVVVSSLQGLIEKAHEKFGATPRMRIVLESDGTEVDEEKFFSKLEQYTCFMILKEGEDWTPPSQHNYLQLETGPSPSHQKDMCDTDKILKHIDESTQKLWKTIEEKDMCDTDKILKLIDESTQKLRKTIEETQVELHELQSLITITAACKLIVTKCERLKKKGAI